MNVGRCKREAKKDAAKGAKALIIYKRSTAAIIFCQTNGFIGRC
jgi:hypothetical protein